MKTNIQTDRDFEAFLVRQGNQDSQNDYKMHTTAKQKQEQEI